MKVLGDGVATLAAPAGDPRGHCYLPPGDLVIATTPFTISTVLGSCIAVCACDAPMTAQQLRRHKPDGFCEKEQRRRV